MVTHLAGMNRGVPDHPSGLSHCKCLIRQWHVLIAFPRRRLTTAVRTIDTVPATIQPRIYVS
eukprot:COSAG02_NODE_1091_length_14628_cov_1693.422810_3_plen_62_part_00